MKDIVDKTEAILIAFDRTFLFFGLPIRQFVHRNLIFPLGHIFHLLFYSSKSCVDPTTAGIVKPEYRNLHPAKSFPLEVDEFASPRRIVIHQTIFKEWCASGE